MTIIEIQAMPNGAHRNQSGKALIISKGWAVVPDDMETPNFPFGDIEVAEIDGVMTVAKWTARDIPEPEPVPITKMEQLRADVDYIAVMTGVEL